MSNLKKPSTLKKIDSPIKVETTLSASESNIDDNDVVIDNNTTIDIGFETSTDKTETIANVNIISDKEVENILANSPMPIVTKNYIKGRISNINFTGLQGTTTHCQITLDNGYSTTGESACVNPENFNKELGEKLSYEQAFNKLWPLFGFLLAEKNFLNKINN